MYYPIPLLAPSPPSQFSSVTQPCATLCDPIDYNTPDSPVHEQLPKLAQTKYASSQ